MITLSLLEENIQGLDRRIDDAIRDTASSSPYILSYEQYGKMARLATFSLSYGSSYKTASHVSGLGLRRVKVIDKQLRGF